MKTNLQEKKMKRIAELLSGNLSYIAGENENGVNGEKAEFLRTSAAFLRTPLETICDCAMICLL